MDSALDSWDSRTVLDHELDSMLTQGPGLTPRLQERAVFPEDFSNLEGSSQHTRSSSMNQNNADPNPLIRYYKDTADPWSSQRVSKHLGHDPMETTNTRDYMLPNHPDFRFPRSPPKSVLSSGRTDIHRLDSGYGTGTRSVASDSARGQSDGSQSVTGDVRRLHVHQYPHSYGPGPVFSPETPYEPGDMISDVPPDIGSLYPMKCIYPGCKKESKNHSDHK